MKTVAKFIKNPELIEAISWTGNNKKEVFEFLDWHVWDKMNDFAEGEKFVFDCSGENKIFSVTTINGETNVTIDDIIVKNENGDLEVLDKKTFENTYFLLRGEDLTRLEAKKGFNKNLKYEPKLKVSNNFKEILKSEADI